MTRRARRNLRAARTQGLYGVLYRPFHGGYWKLCLRNAEVTIPAWVAKRPRTERARWRDNP